MSKKYDVLVVGAGPAGAAAARRCVDAGLSTLVIEKTKLPRRKACSGIIAHGSWRFIKDNFGDIPAEALCKPDKLRGVMIHFEHAPDVKVDFSTPVPYVWRDKFDNWLIGKSGAEVADETTFVSLAEKKREVEVKCTHKGKPVSYHGKLVIAADGGNSNVVHSMAPEAHEDVVWAVAFQRYYKGTISLDGNYFHGFMAQGLGLYPWTNMKDGQVVIGCACKRGEKVEPYHQKLVLFLESRYGFKYDAMLHQEGCLGNAMGVMNRFYLGAGRVLVAGEAAGFLHMAGEGISCALKTGAMAGECAADAIRHRRDPVADYTARTRHEREVNLDQWNPLRMVESSEMMVDMDGVFDEFTRKDKVMMTLDCLNAMRAGWGTGMGSAMFRNMLKRKFLGDY